jgi:hypothetical protein
MKNSELLTYNPQSLLSGLEKQRQLLVREFNIQQPCPNCATPQNVFELTRTNIDDYDFGKGGTDKGECIGCGRELELVVPFMKMAGPHWDWHLVPVAPTKP